jgi:cell division protein FtsW
MTCAALGLLLRVSYELDRAQRQVARVRNEQAPLPTQPSPPGSTAPAPTPPPRLAATAARGTSRLQQRVEPTLGRIA